MGSNLFCIDFSNRWEVIRDKISHWLLVVGNAIYSKNCTSRGTFKVDNLSHKGNIFSSRIIVKIWFSRFCQYWTIVSFKYRFLKRFCDHIFELCALSKKLTYSMSSASQRRRSVLLLKKQYSNYWKEKFEKNSLLKFGTALNVLVRWSLHYIVQDLMIMKKSIW